MVLTALQDAFLDDRAVDQRLFLVPAPAVQVRLP
jgi:hypothetical protein